MAATCPQCATSLDQDFGVVSCPQCHAVLAIDLDGHIEVQQTSGAEDPTVIEPSAEASFNQPVEQDFEPFRETTVTPPPSPEEVVIEEYDPEQVEEIEETPFVPEPQSPLPNNSTGVISYHLTIEGIDTKNLRVSVEEALTDSKFPWTARDVIKQTNMGMLKLGPMNPVAASILVRKLKDLPLTLSWKQSIYE